MFCVCAEEQSTEFSQYFQMPRISFTLRKKLLKKTNIKVLIQ